MLLAADQVPHEPEPHPDPTQAHISFHALMGHSIPQTLSLMGHISRNRVSILVECGSTHNFI